MSSRKVVLSTGFIYHVFNRGLDKRTTFHTKREYERAIETFKFYQYINPGIKFSSFLNMPLEDKLLFLLKVQSLPKRVSIYSYCLMPNHFHFLLKQETDQGISKFISDFSNSYTKYYNAKHHRSGPLFQGIFKATFIENTELLIHVSRYIHLNPFIASLIELESLHSYPWSSYKYYLSDVPHQSIDTSQVLTMFKNRNEYKYFVLDHANYAQQLAKIKHLLIEENV